MIDDRLSQWVASGEFGLRFNDYLHQQLPHNKEPLLAEVTQLVNRVNQFTDEVAKTEYLQLLLDLAEPLAAFSNETMLLEWLIPHWQMMRGNLIANNKAIDTFYSELELARLISLIAKLINDKAGVADFKTMRAILRRYGLMPAFLQFLCQLSGDNLNTAYSF